MSCSINIIGREAIVKLELNPEFIKKILEREQNTPKRIDNIDEMLVTERVEKKMTQKNVLF